MAKHEAPQTPKKRGTKAAIAASFAALLLCGATLVGTTFAWFTDTATTGNNTIKAGELNVELLKWDGEGTTEDGYTKVDENTILFNSTSDKAQDNNEDTLWEPGKTQIVWMAIKNEGNLWLDYDVVLNTTNLGNPAVEGDNDGLSKVMKYQFIGNALGGQDSEGNVLAPTDREKFNWETNGKAVEEGVSTVSDEDESDPDKYYTYLKPGQTHYFALAIHMDEQAGNDYQNEQVEFKLAVNATQYAQEEDSFDKNYDAGAPKIEMAGTVQDVTKALVDGGMVKLIDDLTLTEDTDRIVVSGTTVIDGDGKTISGNRTFLNGGTNLDGIPVGTKLVVENVHFKGTADADGNGQGHAAILGPSDSNGVEIEFRDCVFENLYDAVYCGSANEGSQAKVTITNCTFKNTQYVYSNIESPDAYTVTVANNVDGDGNVFTATEPVPTPGN